MTLREKIEVMEAFERGEEIEIAEYGYSVWRTVKNPSWNWCDHNYRVKTKQKQTVTIEKWLCLDTGTQSYCICEESCVDAYINDDRPYLKKVKLLDTYEVEL